MTSRLWTDQQVTDLFTVVLSNLKLSGAAEIGATPVQVVAENCGFAPTSLIKDCRADKFEHCHYGDGRSMTPTQVGKFLAKVTRGGDYTVMAPTAHDEMAEAREASRKAASRKTPRRAA